jgi:hypothetical protein
MHLVLRQTDTLGERANPELWVFPPQVEDGLRLLGWDLRRPFRAASSLSADPWRGAATPATAPRPASSRAPEAAALERDHGSRDASLSFWPAPPPDAPAAVAAEVALALHEVSSWSREGSAAVSCRCAPAAAPTRHASRSCGCRSVPRPSRRRLRAGRRSCRTLHGRRCAVLGPGEREDERQADSRSRVPSGAAAPSRPSSRVPARSPPCSSRRSRARRRERGATRSLLRGIDRPCLQRRTEEQRFIAAVL